MDFARRQLEKYGWKDGKGLGKNENGISEALKPKLKRSVAGIGYDAASEFNEHWWEKLYDKAATNIQVKEKNGKTKKIKTIDDNNFIITNSMWHLTSKKKESKQKSKYQDYFIKKSTLTPGVSVGECSSASDDEEANLTNKMTDEELFAACGGRTAHKGARHGLKAIGKLARIEEQERRLLLQSKYDGYSHSKPANNKKIIKTNEITITDNDSEKTNAKLIQTVQVQVKKQKNKERNGLISGLDDCGIVNGDLGHKNKKRKKQMNIDNSNSEKGIVLNNTKAKKSKKKLKTVEISNCKINNDNVDENTEEINEIKKQTKQKKSKKKTKLHNLVIDINS